ncbi:recombinase family protein [Arthrobacter sp. B1I2]|uniref:recombinase family protein n=1 Tax=Arthrobacter sp. B1I2 TaxID=3042263 RepID=UPI002787A25F|nr:recombinase family protein [Arthrobacter sp. B1I2]MDQ0731779.1 DNA invertase Pin-like site-specific DNA recombinase [Arthrobacter sp. B1I2]
MEKTPCGRRKPLAIAYTRVSTLEQAEQGASLEAQKNVLAAEAAMRNWDVEVIADEGVSAKSLKRPGLQLALAKLDSGQADYLLSVRLDRVSRSVADFAGLLDRAGRKGWGLALLSPNIDTSDAAGRFTGNVLASAAQYERELIGARTREGMAQRRAEGVKLGRPRSLATGVSDEIVNLRGLGRSLSAIANELNDRGVPTAQGGARWYAATIKKIIVSRSGESDLDGCPWEGLNDDKTVAC